jgi:hypothetical protein
MAPTPMEEVVAGRLELDSKMSTQATGGSGFFLSRHCRYQGMRKSGGQVGGDFVALPSEPKDEPVVLEQSNPPETTWRHNERELEDPITYETITDLVLQPMHDEKGKLLGVLAFDRSSVENLIGQTNQTTYTFDPESKDLHSSTAKYKDVFEPSKFRSVSELLVPKGDKVNLKASTFPDWDNLEKYVWKNLDDTAKYIQIAEMRAKALKTGGGRVSWKSMSMSEIRRAARGAGVKNLAGTRAQLVRRAQAARARTRAVVRAALSHTPASDTRLLR